MSRMQKWWVFMGIVALVADTVYITLAVSDGHDAGIAWSSAIGIPMMVGLLAILGSMLNFAGRRDYKDGHHDLS